METARIEVSAGTKCFIRQFNMSIQNIEHIAKQHNVKLKTEAFDNEGNVQLKCKINIGNIEVSLTSEVFLQKKIAPPKHGL